MHKIYKNIYNQTAYLEEESHKYNFYFSICRSVLQLCATCATCAIELCWEFGEEFGEEDRNYIQNLSSKMLHPSDGDFSEVLDKTIFLLRSKGWKSCIATWFGIPENQKIICEVKPLGQVINNLNKERNNRPAHGVVDTNSIKEGLQWLPDVTLRIIEELQDLLPKNNHNNKLVLKCPLREINIKSIKSVDNNAVVVRKYSKTGSGWRAQYQILDAHESAEGYFDIDENSPLVNFSYSSKATLKSSTVYINGIKWNPAHIIPYKQTETFEGRTDEIKELIEWWNDKDSRTCLVYGDGGIGKTTLVLEFLNDLLASAFTKIDWLPELIFYYSAKQTKWGVSGLEYLSGVAPSIAESVRVLVSILDDSNIREWMKEESRSLIDKAATFLNDVGLNRNQILIVLDNTETLARTQDQVDQLAKILRQMASKLGRILITSRRREKIEAFPVQVPKLDDKTGAVLLRRLGEAYKAQPLISAGESNLADASKKLSGKPLLLDVLARNISNSGCSIKQGVQSVLKQGRSDLGEFLFEDAWSRMHLSHRKIFLILGQLGGAIADQMASWACAEIGVQLDDWLESFSETKFGNLNDYGSNFDINLNPDAREYLIKKYSEENKDEKHTIDSTVMIIRNKHQKLLKAEISNVTDRVAMAFRSSAAKAAKIASMRGQVDEAIMWFEEAVTADPGNHALLDRFAYYLMNRDTTRALGVAIRACQSGPEDADAHFTAGMIAARLANVNEADKYLDMAYKFGKELHLCLLQKARAKINYAKANNLSDQLELLEIARKQLTDATKINGSGFSYLKHLEERKRLQDMISTLISKIRRLKSKNEPQKESVVIYKASKSTPKDE